MRTKLLPYAILGLALILGSTIFGIFFYQSRKPEKSIRVVGSSTQRFSSDIVKWRISLLRTAGKNGMKEGYALINNDLREFVSYLKANGIKDKDITIQPINTEPVFSAYDRPDSPSGYNVRLNLSIVSADIAKVEKLALSPGFLEDKGILIQSSNLEYYYSKISETKRELLASATQDAKRRAAEIAKSTGDRIDKIVSARAGVFQITEPFSTEVADYGIYSTMTKEKDITVTVSTVFSLR